MNIKIMVVALGSVLMLPAFASAAEECCNFQFDNKTRFTLKVFANGVYACTAPGVESPPTYKNYCNAQLPVAIPVTLTVQLPDGKVRTAQTTIAPKKFVTWAVGI